MKLSQFKMTRNRQIPERVYKYEYTKDRITYFLFTGDYGKTFYCGVDLGKGKNNMNLFNVEANSELEGIEKILDFEKSEHGIKKYAEYGI